MKLPKKLLGHAGVYMAGGFLSKAVPFLLLPVFTSYLSPTDYGYLGTFQVLVSVLIVLVGVNLHSAVGVEFFHLEEEEFKKYVGNTFFTSSGVFVLFCLIFLLTDDFLASLIEIPAYLLFVSALIAYLKSITSTVLVIWQVQEKPVSYTVYQFFTISTDMLLSILLVVSFGFGYEGRIIGIITAVLLAAIAGVLFLFFQQSIKFSFDFSQIKSGLRFGVPLIPASLASWVVVGADRLFINSMVSVEATGLYTVGYQIGMVISIMCISFNQAWIPFLYSKLKMNNYAEKVKVVKLTYLALLVIPLLAFLFVQMAPFIFSIFIGENFQGSILYMSWISFAFVFDGYRYLFINYFFYAKKTGWSSLIDTLTALVNIGLNVYLIRLNGALGAAQATLLTFAFNFIVIWFVSNKVISMPWGFFLKKEGG